MTEKSRILLLGCGHARDRRIFPKQTYRQPGDTVFGPGLVTLDCNQWVEPDLWCDLNEHPPWHAYPRSIDVLYRDSDSVAFSKEQEKQHGLCMTEPRFGPIGEPPLAYRIAYAMAESYWDEIHAYEVLEHLGQQGDHLALLRTFAELWRILKPDGYLCCTVPSRFSVGLWGDPGHRRVINQMTLVFLDQSEYIRQCDGPRPTPMSDYRDVYQGDFRCLEHADDNTTFSFVLQAVKPSRWIDPRKKERT